MSPEKPRSHLFSYSIIVIIAVLAIAFAFFRGYQMGDVAGRNAPPPAEGTRTTAAVANEQALAKDMSLSAKGKTLFAINCASCHGTDGHGNGDRAASINPKPRNFHTEQFKYGNDIVAIHSTILKGSPGTSMPSFMLLPLEETWALAHFVYTQIPNPPPITDALVASLPTGSPASSAGGKPAVTSAAASTAGNIDSVRIPIDLAVQRMTVPASATHGAGRVNSSLPGAAIYAKHCASCHGARGEGKAELVLSVAPYRYEYSESLAASTAPWTRDRNKFVELVVKGLPGRAMPGQATLTTQQLDDLYTFVHSLQTP